MEFRGNRQQVVQHRKTRSFALLGTILLLFGLILKVQAHAPVTKENSTIHTFRPVLVEDLLTFETLHPPAKPVPPAQPAPLLNPTSITDLDGRSCLDCHPGSRLLATQPARKTIQEVLLQGHRGTKPGYTCETCHFVQLSQVNEGILSR